MAEAKPKQKATKVKATSNRSTRTPSQLSTLRADVTAHTPEPTQRSPTTQGCEHEGSLASWHGDAPEPFHQSVEPDAVALAAMAHEPYHPPHVSSLAAFAQWARARKRWRKKARTPKLSKPDTPSKSEPPSQRQHWGWLEALQKFDSGGATVEWIGLEGLIRRGVINVVWAPKGHGKSTLAGHLGSIFTGTVFPGWHHYNRGPSYSRLCDRRE
jgi:hypothetical protein